MVTKEGNTNVSKCYFLQTSNEYAKAITAVSLSTEFGALRFHYRSSEELSLS